MKKNYDIISEPLAKVGYETMFEDRWDDLHPQSIERVLWRNVALNMIAELWRVYKYETKRAEAKDTTQENTH